MISSNNNDENKLGTLNVDSVTKKKIIQNLFHKFTKRTTTSPSTTKDPNRVIQGEFNELKTLFLSNLVQIN